MNYHSGNLNVRRFAVMTFALIMALALTTAFTASSADAKKKSKKAKVTLKVTTKNQAALLKANKLKVKVKSTGKTKVKLSAVYSGKANLFKKKTVKFKKNRKQTKTISLKLTRNGKKKLSTCGAKTVVAKGVYKKKANKKKKSTAKKKKKLAKSNAQCGSPNPPPIVPVKSTCDPLDPKVCMQPWPSNFYTKEASTATGVQLDIPAAAMPKNTEETPIDPTDINRADGFSVGNLITTKIPEVQTPAAFNNSGITPIDDISSYSSPNAPVMVINAATGVAQPIWAELDAVPTSKPVAELTAGQPPVPIIGGSPNDDPGNTADVNLIIRAAKNYTPGQRYVVVLRNLKNESNQSVEAAAPFKQCRDDAAGITDPELLFRCNQLEDKVFPVLDQHGISKSGLYLAWDFTVASDESTTGRATTIRDDAFAQLGDTNLADKVIQGSSPTINVVAFCDQSEGPVYPAKCGGNYPGLPSFNPDNTVQSPSPAANEQRTVTGYIEDVPCYLDQNGCPSGSKFAFDSNGQITWNDAFTVDVPFLCSIPKSITDGGQVNPGGTGIYGHGLLGTLNQVRSGGSTREIGNDNNSVWCGTNWDGFSELDFGTVAASLKDLSNFNKLTDRMQQGFVNFMMIQRAMVHPDGMADEPAFQMTDDGITPITAGSAIDTTAGTGTRGYYHGISQGGIMGGALTALSPDSDNGVLGVPGINYSTLLSRSVDFDEYAHGVISGIYLPGVGLYDNYTSQAELPLIFSIMQLLWDRGEGNGYMHTMNPANPPLPNTPPHDVLLGVAIGDHQVANITAEVAARTVGAGRYSPTLEAGRHWDDEYFGITAFGTAQAAGNSALIYYDGGPVGYDCTSPGVPAGCRGQGSVVPPNENVPPRPEWGYGGDPHSYPRHSVDGISQAADFLDYQGVTPCTGATYCFTNGWTGAP